MRIPPSNKVIKTRYRIVKKTPSTPFGAPSFPSSLPSWRARRISLSRSLVLNRLRPTITGGGKASPGSPRWRNKGYRCIGGVLYKVSANKLSKTSSRPSDSNKALLRTGRLDPVTTCSRSLASRAIQRSLAIIRQAKQKKEKKREYCMYYNRFGRCNRGECCPYIHDPEKVAVCTRFVRGTCKKTDGSCPFSHHVSKEKMPVCSYFLKGICSNSNCPYSHVYVSRKAEVCSDFLKGYCPLGAKCKKKHTLLCPDFARRGICPRGSQCQLLHRNQKRHGRRTAAPPILGPSDGTPRSKASAGHVLRKPTTTQRSARQMSSGLASRTEDPASPPPSPRVLASTSTLSSKATAASSPSSSPSTSSPTPSLDQEEAVSGTGGTGSGTGSSSLCKLPSFISLHSSPSPGGQTGPQPPRSPRTKDSGKPLHIKPRL
ncbi:zinc finger CCCH domain-containing protein 3 isoform X4 [Arvicanthis niloticus]